MGQKDGEKWTAAVNLQPTISKSDRLLGAASQAVREYDKTQQRRQKSFSNGSYLAPQHRSVPVFTSLLSTPAMDLAAISVTPVSV